METLKVSKDGNFRLCKRNGVGMQDTPFEELKVISDGNAEKYVVEIRLKSGFMPFEGKPVKYRYSEAYISYGIRGSQNSLLDIQEFIEVLQEAMDFVHVINDYIESNSEWKK